MARRRRLRIDQARRVAIRRGLLARGGDRGTTGRRPGPGAFRKVLDRLGVVQIDSVNVVARAHYLPFFSRLGPFDPVRLDRWLWRSGEAFEHWGHQASLMPIGRHPMLRHRMASFRPWPAVARLLEHEPGYVDRVYEEVARHGPASVTTLSDPGERSGPWWGMPKGRVALDWLYMTGRLAIHHRTDTFVTVYDLPERVIPAAVLSTAPMAPAEAHAQMLKIAARAQGVATADDLADHFRLKMREARPAIERLVAAGELVEVDVEGWDRPAYADPELTIPRAVDARALLVPFDPFVWYRPRLARLFGFEYRIEIYVPADRRRYGYYVLPFLFGDRIVARVDLKADRATGRLRALGAWTEAHGDPKAIAGPLAVELALLADHLGLGEVVAGERGDLAKELRRRL